MNPIDFIPLLAPPMLAGAIVLSTHVPLGRQVLARGIIFIDLAIAQLAGLGGILVHLLKPQPSAWEVQLAAFIAALIGALGLHWAERRLAKELEALIGVVFVLAVAAALLLLANDPHGGEQLKELLAGQLLWVTYEDLWPAAAGSLGVLLVWFLGNAAHRSWLFYVLFALSVTMSVQLVGVYLVFASLIIPALAARRRQGLAFAYGVGLVGYLLGLAGSAAWDLPSGPLTVWAMALSAVISTAYIATMPKSN